MKTIKNVFVLLLLAAGWAQAQTQGSGQAQAQSKDITVQGEKKLNTDFKNYKTYGWLKSDQQNGQGQVVEYIYMRSQLPTATSGTERAKMSTWSTHTASLSLQKIRP